MTDHHLVGTVGAPRSVTSCSCGWLSVPAVSEEQAAVRWRIHVAERRAARWSADAVRVGSAARARCQQLARVREAAHQRRLTLATERQRLRAGIERVRAATPRAIAVLPDPAPPPAVVRLEEGRVMAGRSLVDLWWDYFELDGKASLDQLGEMLAGARPMGELDHDIVALALNERFADAGFGHPLDYWARRLDQ